MTHSDSAVNVRSATDQLLAISFYVHSTTGSWGAMTHILALDRVCGPCEPALGRLASCPRSGRRPGTQHSELPLSRYESKREIQISIMLSSIVFGDSALQSFCDKLRGGRKGSGNSGSQLFNRPDARIHADPKKRAKTEAASVTDEFGASFDSRLPRRKRRSRDHRPRKRGDE